MVDLTSNYYTKQLITYIGNKRKLLPFLNSIISDLYIKNGFNKMKILDGFAGSGSVSRLLKAYSSELHSNDLEDYCFTVNSAFLKNKSEINMLDLESYITKLNYYIDNIEDNTEAGFIEKNYAPKDDNNIKHGERVFFTKKNAKIIDKLRYEIGFFPEPYNSICLALLITEASIHNNTSGVFKGFHKKNGIGHFGGSGENALSRIKSDIKIEMPLFSEYECDVFIHKQDINKLVKNPNLPLFDIVYYDPPYNQHPYGSNYFMLNIINNGVPIEIQDGVSGISKFWNKSDYNKKKIAVESMYDLLKNTKSRYILISYNDEGIIPINDFENILGELGKWRLFEQSYNTYRGSRNLKNRNIKVKELLWLLEK